MMTIYDLMDRSSIDLSQRKRAYFPDITDETFWSLYEQCSPYSMAHVTGFFNAYQAMRHVASAKLRGDIVECGCLLGGMTMFLAALCNRLDLHDKRVIVFDTFEGFPEGQVDALLGSQTPIHGHRYGSILSQVKDNLSQIEAISARIDIVEGMVEETLPHFARRDLALVRLDTDFYMSTKSELENLYPSLVSGGVLIVDDYGMFKGAREATDEYLVSLDRPPLMNRIDMSVWSGQKP